MHALMHASMKDKIGLSADSISLAVSLSTLVYIGLFSLECASRRTNASYLTISGLSLIVLSCICRLGIDYISRI